MFNTKLTPVIGLILSSSLLACGGTGAEFDTVGNQNAEIVTSGEVAFIASMTQAARDGTVSFLNDSATTEDQLDDDCGLHSDAAKFRQIFNRQNCAGIPAGTADRTGCEFLHRSSGPDLQTVGLHRSRS